MITFTPLGTPEQPPTALEIAGRVEAQEAVLSSVIEGISDALGYRVDAQERKLKPIYKGLVRDIGKRIDGNAELIAPIGRRILTNLRSRLATQSAKLANVNGTLQRVTGEAIAVAPLPGETLNTAIGGITNGTASGIVRTISPIEQSEIPLYTTTPTGEIVSAIPPALQTPETPIAPITPDSGTVLPTILPVGDTCGTTVVVNPPPVVCPVSPTAPKLPPEAPVSPGVVLPTVPPTGPPVGPPATPPTTETPATSVPDRPIPDIAFARTAIDWCNANPCKVADMAVGIHTQESAHRLQRGNDGSPHSAMDEVAYTVMSGAQLGVDLVSRFVPGKLVENLAVGMGETAGRYIVALTTGGSILNDLMPSGLNNKEAAISLIAKLGAGNIVSQETGIPIDYLMTAETYLLRYTNPQFILSQDEIDRCWMADTINDNQWDCWTRAQGNIPECRVSLLHASSQKPSVLDLITLYRRGYIRNKDELYRRMRALGVLVDRHMEEWLSVTQQLPTPADLIHLSVRDVFDPNKLGRAEMLAEFREQTGMQELFEAQGYGEFSIFTKDGRKLTYNAAELEWLASYEEASPTQSYEFLHRLRPNRVHFFTQFIPGKTPKELQSILPGADIRVSPDGKGSLVTPRPFTLYEVAKNLKEKDYNPVHRDKLAAISFRVVGRIDLRRFYRSGLFGTPVGRKGFLRGANNTVTATGVAEVELVERYMDEGYTYTDASLHAYYTAIEWEDGRDKRARGKAATKICTAYKLGVFDYLTALQEMEKVATDDTEAKRLLDECNTDHKLAIVKTTVQGIRKKFVSGEWDENETKKQLIAAGIHMQRIQELITLWKLQIARLDKQATAQQMVQWYVDGELTRKQLLDRLVRIGWDRQDADRIIKHAELGELAKSAKVRERQQRARAAELRRLAAREEATQKEQQRKRDKEFAAFLRFRSEKNLKEWWKEGTITEGAIYETLILKGASDADARRWLDANNPNKQSGGNSGTDK